MFESKQPLLVLAPMYNVTDVVFRQIIASCQAPDVFVTEFVNVEGLQSRGRAKLLPFLHLEKGGTPVWAQIWGKNPENYYKTARELVDMGFAGIDINMGCPDKTVLKNNSCAALIDPCHRHLVSEIIAATKEGAGSLPVSVKTRLGLKEIDLSWHEFLLKQPISCLSVHARTVAEKSKVPAHWPAIAQIKVLARQINPDIKVIGNGDITSYQQARELCRDYGWDGAMIGRAIFEDPFLFSSDSPWSDFKAEARISLYKQHLELFAKTYLQRERPFEIIKKFMKVYLTGFAHAQTLRQKIANSQSIAEAIKILEQNLQEE